MRRCETTTSETSSRKPSERSASYLTDTMLFQSCQECDFVKPAAMNVLDINQYGAVPKSSTAIVLLNMIHNWTISTNGHGSTVRTILFDGRKAFDLIDHRLVANKPYNLEISRILTSSVTVSKEPS